MTSSARSRSRSLALPLAVVTIAAAGLAGADTSRPEGGGDAGSGADAGNTFATATPVDPSGFYEGVLEGAPGDVDDFYRFHLDEGSSVSVLLGIPSSVNRPALLDPEGRLVDIGEHQYGVGVSLSAALTSEAGAVRLSVHRALVGGEYRLHLGTASARPSPYSLCFMNCDEVRRDPIDLIFGGSLRQPHARVLMVPPSHGDLGNPAGPSVLDYLEATLRGIHGWTRAMAAFAEDYPRFGYLRDITVDVEVFDGVTPVELDDYDVLLGYVAAGPAFRGVAAQVPWPFDVTRFKGRTILLSLFGSAPRSGQVVYDFPEVNDLEIVTFHEFGHTFGLGHTRTWTAEFGADLMNSPASFVYGDGSPAGDGGERTPMDCLSSLDLYGMAYLYRWLETGRWVPSYGAVDLPTDIPYTWYC